MEGKGREGKGREGIREKEKEKCGGQKGREGKGREGKGLILINLFNLLQITACL